jgi:DNA-directed RNA polymerase II subunit RPB1
MDQISGISLGILSNEKIRKLSKTTVTIPDASDDYRQATLSDGSFGTTSPYHICGTCNQDMNTCAGHFGQIELGHMVYMNPYLKLIVPILQSVCPRCSKLYVDPKESFYRELELVKMQTPEGGKRRLNAIKNLIKNVKACGNCKTHRPIIKKNDKPHINVIAEFERDSEVGSDGEGGTGKVVQKKIISGREAFNILSNISNDDLITLGLNPIDSSPSFCIVDRVPVLPVVCRPQVKSGDGKVQEDDLTHKYADIVKVVNKYIKLREKEVEPINPENSYLMRLSDLIHYHIATLIDNESSSVQRSTKRNGQFTASLKGNFDGKGGRVRKNLMGKRVDFSARSVITPNPCMKIEEIALPRRVAMSLTIPERVTQENIEKMTMLITNGPHEYPGANLIDLTRKKETKNLEYAKNKVIIEPGDIVHRHLVDGDIVLLNRQPSLHKYSMMGMVARILSEDMSDRFLTFQFNPVICTPFNADFDGDEMNIHVPQSARARTELQMLAALPQQIVSAAKCAPQISLNMDTLLGSWMMTDDEVRLTRLQVANILSYTTLKQPPLTKGIYTGKELFSMIIPPNITLRNKGVVIENSVMKAGQLSKPTMGCNKTNSIVHAVWNQYGANVCKDFLNNAMEMANRYIMIRGITVGIRDIIPTPKIRDLVKTMIESKFLEIQSMFYEVESGASLYDIEGAENIAYQKLNSVLGVIGPIIANNMEKTNNVYSMAVGSGSKGGPANIGQMSGCLAQQSYVRPSGTTRIPKDYNGRTLPHYYQNDDSMEARGFVTNCYLDGLTPGEFFAHCQVGRVGLIDTAVKTADTGYLQRKIIKCLEDVHVHADGVVRRANGEVVQWRYGDDGIDPAKLHKQSLSIMMDDDEKVRATHAFTAAEQKSLKITDKQNEAMLSRILELRDNLRGSFENLFYDTGYISDTFFMPINFQMFVDIIKSKPKKNDLTFEHVSKTLEDFFDSRDMYGIPISKNEWNDQDFPLHKTEKISLQTIQCALYMYFSPKQCIIDYKIGKETFDEIIKSMRDVFKKSIVNSGEMVGVIAAQSIGEPMTQMTLNTFHSTGIAAKGTGQIGVPRLRELMRVSKNQKSSGMTIFLEPGYEEDKSKVDQIKNYMAEIYLSDIAIRSTVIYDPKFAYKERDEIEDMYYVLSGDQSEPSNLHSLPFLLRIELDRDMMYEHNISLFDVRLQFMRFWDYQKEIKSKNMKHVFDILESIVVMSNFDNDDIPMLHIRFQMTKIRYEILDEFEEMILNLFRIRGIDGIQETIVKPSHFIQFDQKGAIRKDADGFIIDTVGINRAQLMDIIGIDHFRTATNDMWVTFVELGIEAARYQLIKEFRRVSSEFESINYHHVSLLVDFMCQTGIFTTIDRYGIQKLNIDIMAKASFEQTTETLLQGAFFGVKDKMESISSNIMAGNLCRLGTGMIDLMMDTDALIESRMSKIIAEENVVLLDKNPLIDDLLSKPVNPEVYVPDFAV